MGGEGADSVKVSVDYFDGSYNSFREVTSVIETFDHTIIIVRGNESTEESHKIASSAIKRLAKYHAPAVEAGCAGPETE